MYSHTVVLLGKGYRIRLANELDLEVIQGLLTGSGLPIVGLEGYIKQFLVAEQNQVIGVIGVHYGRRIALLRSFVVNVQERKCGVGMSLVKQALDHIKSQGIGEVYLLTETAVDYFKKIGFLKINREQMPMDLLEESGLKDACPCSSYCMKILL